MRYLLNCIYTLLLFFALPILLYRAIRHGKYRDGLEQKLLGRVPEFSPTSQRIWIHAVSVGEVNLLRPLIRRLLRSRPACEIVISTTTKTGFELARKKYDSHTTFWCPIDFSWAVSNAFDRVKPDMLVLAELELWPNLLAEAKRRDVPVAIINGRLSDRSTKGYLRVSRLMPNWLSAVRTVAAQSETCAERFRKLGAANVEHVGSIKFDGAESDRNNPRTQELKELAGIKTHDCVLLAGSTQHPEESIALRVWQRLSTEHPNLRLILVPRHPERYAEVRKLLEESGVAWQARTELQPGSTPTPVLLVDTVGELGAWWGTADIGFVGGCMGSRGGQNMIEPAAYGVATCFGPNTRNFRDVVQLLLAHAAAQVVQNEDELEEFVRRCISDPAFRSEIGNSARRLASEQRGAADRTVELIASLLSDETDFRAQRKIA